MKDGRGLKVFGEGEWKVRKHGVDKQRVWRKVHLAVNTVDHQGVAAEVSLDHVSDGEMSPTLLKRIRRQIDTVAVEAVREKGRKEWKKQSGYHVRSLSETTIYRLKQLTCGKL